MAVISGFNVASLSSHKLNGPSFYAKRQGGRRKHKDNKNKGTPQPLILAGEFPIES